MPIRVFFFNGENTIVDADTEEEATEVVWHFTSAQIEKFEKVDGDNGRQGHDQESLQGSRRASRRAVS